MTRCKPGAVWKLQEKQAGRAASLLSRGNVLWTSLTSPNVDLNPGTFGTDMFSRKFYPQPPCRCLVEFSCRLQAALGLKAAECFGCLWAKSPIKQAGIIAKFFEPLVRHMTSRL